MSECKVIECPAYDKTHIQKCFTRNPLTCLISNMIGCYYKVINDRGQLRIDIKEQVKYREKVVENWQRMYKTIEQERDSLTAERDLLKKVLRMQLMDNRHCVLTNTLVDICGFSCGSDECIELHIAREQEGE